MTHFKSLATVAVLMAFTCASVSVDAQQYVKVESPADLVEGNYVILYENEAMSGHVSGTADNAIWCSTDGTQEEVLGTEVVTLTDGVALHPDCIWTISVPEEGVFAIGRDGNYLKGCYDDDKAKSEKELAVGNEPTKGKQQWEITLTSAGKWSIRNHDEEVHDRYLMHHVSDGKGRFANYDDPEETEKKYPTAIYRVVEGSAALSVPVVNENIPVRYYNLMGQLVEKPVKGHLYITSRGEKVIFR